LKPHLRVAELPDPSLEDSIYGLKVVLAQFQERLEALEARSFLSEARHDVDVQAIRLRLDALQTR
jgi:hypothetical protein